MADKAVYQLSVRQILLIALLSAGMATAGVTGFNYFSSGVQPTINAEEAVYNSEPLAGVSDPQTVTDEQNNIEVYRTISPGVAQISASSSGRGGYGEERDGSGSGSVIDADGHILTNFHVIEDATELSVDLGGKKYPARKIGGDPDTDLAVIKIDAPREALTIVPFGDSDRLTVGQKVLAIGNPFGLDRTLSTGVISGLQRPLRGTNGRPIEGAVQTDASINPGNSGGPLLDSRGRMIGINSQIYSRTGNSVGVGFAVPVGIAKRVVPQLIQFGEVRRPKLGVSAYSVQQLKRSGMRLPVEEGLYLDEVVPGGSAANAGLRGTTEAANGDIVLTVDGAKVNSIDELYKTLDRRQIGDTVPVEILRENRRQTVQVKLVANPLQRRTAPR